MNLLSPRLACWPLLESGPPQLTTAKYLNGCGVGSRYDGNYPGSTGVGSYTGLTGGASPFSNEYRAFLRQHWEAQLITYEKAGGWIQWTWKAENADEYNAGIANEWIPQNPTDLQHRNICDYLKVGHVDDSLALG